MQTRTVLFEKTFNFKVQCFSFFSLKKKTMPPFFHSIYDDFEKFWKRVYENGYSALIKLEIKKLQKKLS